MVEVEEEMEVEVEVTEAMEVEVREATKMEAMDMEATKVDLKVKAVHLAMTKAKLVDFSKAEVELAKAKTMHNMDKIANDKMHHLIREVMCLVHN